MSVKAVTIKQIRDAALKAGYSIGQAPRKTSGGWGYTGYWLIPPGNPNYIEKDIGRVFNDELSPFAMTPQTVLERDFIFYDDTRFSVTGDARPAVRVGTRVPYHICELTKEDDVDALNEIIGHGGYGVSNLVLTRADIHRLMNGEAIIWHQYEYNTCIYFADDVE